MNPQLFPLFSISFSVVCSLSYSFPLDTLLPLLPLHHFLSPPPLYKSLFDTLFRFLTPRRFHPAPPPHKSPFGCVFPPSNSSYFSFSTALPHPLPPPPFHHVFSYHVQRQKSFPNKCSSLCSHLCLLKQSSVDPDGVEAACLCPTGHRNLIEGGKMVCQQSKHFLKLFQWLYGNFYHLFNSFFITYGKVLK